MSAAQQGIVTVLLQKKEYDRRRPCSYTALRRISSFSRLSHYLLFSFSYFCFLLRFTPWQQIMLNTDAAVLTHLQIISLSTTHKCSAFPNANQGWLP